MKEFKVEYSALFSRKYTINLERIYTSLKTDNIYVQAGIDMIDGFRPKARERMLEWRRKQSEAELKYEQEKMAYYGCISMYGIIWHIIQASPDVKFTAIGLARWLKIPRSTVVYHLKKMIQIGDVKRTPKGFMSTQ